MRRLVTRRFELREWVESDAQDLFAYAKGPKVGPMAGWKPHESMGESIEILNHFIKDDETWAACDRNTGRVVGSVGLHADHKRMLSKDQVRMLGYVLDEPYWGQGAMPEIGGEVLRFAFEELGLELVSVYHYPFNLQSKRVIEKLGFRYEGTIRCATLRYDGAILDDVCYSMTRAEYLAQADRHPSKETAAFT